jgi:hypothetical protein
MPKAKKLDLDQFNKPPVLNMKTSEQKLLYTGLRGAADDEGILEYDPKFLVLRIFGESHRRYKHFLSNMSVLEKMGAIVKFESEGKRYLILPFHFDHEGTIQYFSPTIHPRPQQEFYLKHPHYHRGWKFHMDKIQKSSQGGRLPSDTPLVDPEGGRGGSEGGRGGSEGARGSQRVAEGQRFGGSERLHKAMERFFEKHNIPYDPLTLKPLNVSHSEKTLNVGGSGEGKGSVKGVIREKGESPKGEKEQAGEITLERILKVCGDERSKNFYKLVLARCPQKMVRTALIETQCIIQEKKLRTTPGRYFTGLIIKLAAKERISLDGSKRSRTD